MYSYKKKLPHIMGNEAKPNKEHTHNISPRAQQHIAYKLTSQNNVPSFVACAILRRCPVDAASHQMTHVAIGCLQADENLHADSSFNLCTTSIILHLDHTTKHNRIPPNNSHVIVAKFIVLTIEQLRLLVSSSDDFPYERKLHRIEHALAQGYALLALQAYLPSLRPPPCKIETEPSNCKEVHGWNAVLLYAALYLSAFGEGCVRACLPSLGADQFDHEDPIESRQQSSFFNWFTFGISIGGLLGLILVVWLENDKGWDIGLGLSSILILIGLLVVAAGLPFYRNQVPEGSPLTRILQVLVVAFRNRKLELPEKLEEAQENSAWLGTIEALRGTNNLKFLDKACINRGKVGAWSHCSIAKVEETKIVLRLLPLFLSSMIGYVSNPILLTFTVQQGGMTNTRLGKIHVSPATLFIIPITFQTVMLAIYDRFIVPFLRRRTDYASGITHLQRISVGFISMILASVIAAVVERKRKEAAAQMSLFWLTPQFFLLGVSDVTSFPGLLEFFNSEAPQGMKSIATALFWCELGLASLLATLLVQAVNKATRHGHQGGWLEGTSLNNSRLDLFYWVASVVGLLAFLNYLYWAKRYVYRQDPRIVDDQPVDQDSN